MEPTPQAMPSRPACLPQERRGLRVRSRSSATSTHREAFTRDRQYQQRLASLTDLSNPSSHTHFCPGVSYPASKATVNAITIQLAKEFPGIRINAVEPGYTRTDLNGRTAPKPWRKARRSSSAWPKSVPMDRPEPTFRPRTDPLVSRARARTRHTGVRARRTKSDNTRTHGRCDADQEDVKIVGRGPTWPA